MLLQLLIQLFYKEGDNTTGTLNTNSRFTLTFLATKFNKCKILESQSFATILTHKTQVQFEMNHDIILTNVGNDAFN